MFYFNKSGIHSSFAQLLSNFSQENQALNMTEGADTEANKLFIGGLARETTDDGFHNFFIQYGTLTDHVIMRDASGISRGFGFVAFESPEQCEKALAASRTLLDGRKLDIKKAIPRDQLSKGSQVKKVFIQGLPDETTEDSLREYFESFGEVVEITLIRNHDDSKIRGFGFVTFDQGDVATTVCASSDLLLHGKSVTAQIARPKREGSTRGGGGGRGRGGGRGGGFDAGYGGGFQAGGYGAAPAYGGGYAAAPSPYAPPASAYGGGYGDASYGAPVSNYGAPAGYGAPSYGAAPTGYGATNGYQQPGAYGAGGQNARYHPYGGGY